MIRYKILHYVQDDNMPSVSFRVQRRIQARVIQSAAKNLLGVEVIGPGTMESGSKTLAKSLQ